MKIYENGTLRDMTAEEIAAFAKRAAIAEAEAKTQPMSQSEILRMLMQQIVATLDVDDATASRMVDYYPEWATGRSYATGIMVQYGGVLYKCVQAHTSQTGWAPDATPALWDAVQYRNGYRVIPETITATGAFELGECGWWGDHLYKSLVATNVWTPEAYAAGWEVII